MNWFEKLIHILQFKTTKPEPFGLYHIGVLLLLVVLTTFVFMFRKKISKKFINITLLVLGIVLVSSEILKQIINSLEVVDGVAVWEYSWRKFPFQFCSVPTYLFLLAGILRKGKVYDTILTFLATFSLFAGISVIIYPSTVLSSTLYISIHTMVWHCSMGIVGFMLWATNSVELSYKAVLKACIIFAIILVMAQTMNILWHYFGIPDKEFNMFYLSPYYKSDLPISIIWDYTCYPVFFLSYALGFPLIAIAIMAIAIIINEKCQNQKIKKVEK